MSGDALLTSGCLVSALTEAAYQFVATDIGLVSEEALMDRLDEFAELVEGDVLRYPAQRLSTDFLKREVEWREPFGDSTYTLIDTAGIRRRKNVKEMVEKFSIVKTSKKKLLMPSTMKRK